MLQARRFFIYLALVLGTSCCGARAENAPPNPFVDQGACPFECCTYRDWTTNAAVDLFDKPNGRKIDTLDAGTPVTGLTGEVISWPVRLRAARDYQDTTIRKGDIFYALHYSGEGYWAVWHKGKLQHAEFSGDELEGPHVKPVSEVEKDRSIWWVKIKTKKGRLGWAISDGNFNNQDACG